MSISRRSLFKILGAGLALQSCVPSKNKGAVIRSTETIYSGFRLGGPHSETPSGLAISTPFSVEKIVLANEIHAIEHSPSLDIKVFISKLELLSYGQIGNGPLIEIHPEPGNFFYGHGVIDDKRKLLYTTQAIKSKSREGAERANYPGFVYVHSLTDFKIIDKFPTFGNDPHDLKILNDELIVCNGGKDSSICFINLENRKLIREYKVGVEHIKLRHIEIINDQNFVIGTLSTEIKKTTPLYGLNIKEGLKVYKMPDGLEEVLMRIQLLSVLHHKGYIYATCPSTESVLVWNVQGEFIGGQKIPSAAGLAVSKDLDGVLVGTGRPGEKARIIFVKDDQIVKVHKLEWASWISGSHAKIV